MRRSPYTRPPPAATHPLRRNISRMQLLTPVSRAVAQLDDPAFLAVALRSAAWSAAAFALLAVGAAWGVHAGVVALHGAGWLGWLVGTLGGLGAALLSLWLFVPIAAVIATLYCDRIAIAVERRFYPMDPPGRTAPWGEQASEAWSLGVRVLGLQLATLVLGILLPGIGSLLGWLVAAFAVGRGLFVAVAMRRMDRPAALALYARLRLAVLAQGGLVVAASLVPVVNLVAPVLGIAVMVHLLHLARPQRLGHPGL